MNTKLLVCVSFAALTGCSFAARSPDMYRDDTTKVLETKNSEIQACYDGVLKTTPGAGGSVTVTFDVKDDTGQIENVKVDPAGTTAPPPVAECVTKAIGSGLAISPPDARLGKATYVYEFTAPKT